jgi:hypothetical protein
MLVVISFRQVCHTRTSSTNERSSVFKQKKAVHIEKSNQAFALMSEISKKKVPGGCHGAENRPLISSSRLILNDTVLIAARLAEL